MFKIITQRITQKIFCVIGIIFLCVIISVPRAQASFSLLGHGSALCSGSVTSTTYNFDSTGATIIDVSIARGQLIAGTDTAVSVTDDQGNTYSKFPPTYSVTGSRNYTQNWYVVNPATSASHTITISSTIGNCSTSGSIDAAVVWFSGTNPSAESTKTEHTQGNYKNIQPGSITPTSGTDLFITSVAGYEGGLNPSGWTINSSFTIVENHFGVGATSDIALAYKLSSSAENPTWTTSGSVQDGHTSMVAFSEGAGGGGGGGAFSPMIRLTHSIVRMVGGRFLFR